MSPLLLIRVPPAADNINRSSAFVDLITGYQRYCTESTCGKVALVSDVHGLQTDIISSTMIKF